MTPPLAFEPQALARRRRFLAAAGALATLSLVRPVRAAEPPINTLRNSAFGATRTDTAIGGYDPVAYFTVNRAVPGRDAWVHEWNGAKWKFSSAENLERFKADPSRYAPQYGGYCAYGVAKGALFKVDPEQFAIRDGKLYLNFDANVQARWLKDVPGFVRTADARFAQLLQK